jgi:hypothetical protein
LPLILRRPQKSEADMRKSTSFTLVAAIMGLTALFWVKSSVDASSADARSKVAASYVVTSGSYLPFQVLEPIY